MAELKVRLHVKGKPDKILPVTHNPSTLGRSPKCKVHLPFLGVSRYHARFFKAANGAWLLEDLDSRNGTRLNRRSLKTPQKVNHGDIIHIGTVCLRAILTETPQQPRPRNDSIDEGVTILRNARDLQQQWIRANSQGDKSANQEKTIARLQDLVEIAKALTSAESIESIFSEVKDVVFRYLPSISRLALLIDTAKSGQLKLLNAAARTAREQRQMNADGSWISRTICQKVFADKVAIQTADAQSDERFEDELSIIANDIHSAMAVPLWNEDKVVGVLYADAHLSFNDWTLAGEEDLSFFSALANLVAASVQRWLLEQQLRDEESIRQKLERYHSPGVVQQMMAAGVWENGRISPKDAEVSILFADIVGFTELSERLTPTQIAELLNSFFEEMLQEVFSVEGTLDKFIGDCIMAFFGAPEPQADHAQRAMNAARGMLDRLERLNARQFWREPLQLRIAINSGRAVVGDVGSSQRVDYTVLGATINLASRMEAICPLGECVVGETTYALLRTPPDLEEMGEFRFKGIDRPTKVYRTKRRNAPLGDRLDAG